MKLNLKLKKTSLKKIIFAYPCDFLDEFLRHIFGEKFGPELKLKWRFFLDILTLNLNKK